MTSRLCTPPLRFKPALTLLYLASTLLTPLLCLGQEGATLPAVEVTAGRLQVKQFDTPAATYLVDQNFIANDVSMVIIEQFKMVNIKHNIDKPLLRQT